ncbi:MAG TPA: hypothetical protein VNT32_08515 [Thermoleophilaceae bacterium]|nr:hypothetical protein [Thermoleophilaceae bacterium]
MDLALQITALALAAGVAWRVARAAPVAALLAACLFGAVAQNGLVEIPKPEALARWQQDQATRIACERAAVRGLTASDEETVRLLERHCRG